MASPNLLVAHGGGPTPVINASLAGVVREAQRQPGIDRILAARHGIEGVLLDDLVDLTEMSEEELVRLERTPSSAIGSCRYKVGEGDFERIAAVLDARRIGFFLYNGGNDSMDTCLHMSKQMSEVAVAGIPKTIDNDLAVTDHSPGFGSAARYYAVSTAELCLDAAALGIQVSVLEVMGRNAGWLAASSVLARRLDDSFPLFVMLPERPLDREGFLAAVETAWGRSHGFVVVASEGLTDSSGVVLGSDASKAGTDAFGHKMPGGVGEYLAGIIRSGLGIRARSEKPGLLGRASRSLVSEVDLTEARLCGEYAVSELCEGRSGFMVGLRRGQGTDYSVTTECIELERVANVERKLPDEYISESGMDVTPAFVDYCRPLIGVDPFEPYFVLPRKA